jgi:hypothetical protein
VAWGSPTELQGSPSQLLLMTQVGWSVQKQLPEWPWPCILVEGKKMRKVINSCKFLTTFWVSYTFLFQKKETNYNCTQFNP